MQGRVLHQKRQAYLGSGRTILRIQPGKLVMKTDAFTDGQRAERISTQIFGLGLAVIFVGMLLLNAISY